MATIDLGKVALVWKGTFDSATTYESKDVVQYTDSGEVSSYIYVNASGASGQTPSTGGTVNTTYWNKMAGGTSLSVGNNKIVTTDASGNISSVAMGTANQAMQVNAAGNGFEFGTIDSGKIKQTHWQWDNQQASIPAASNGGTGLDVVNYSFTAQSDNPHFVLDYSCFVGRLQNGNDGGDVYLAAWIDKNGTIKYPFGFKKTSAFRAASAFVNLTGGYFLEETDAGNYSDTGDWGGQRCNWSGVMGNQASPDSSPQPSSGISAGDTLTLNIHIGGSGQTYFNRTQNQVNSMSRSWFRLQELDNSL